MAAIVDITAGAMMKNLKPDVFMELAKYADAVGDTMKTSTAEGFRELAEAAALGRSRTIAQIVGIMDLDAALGQSSESMNDMEKASARAEIMLERLRLKFPDVANEAKSMADKMESLRVVLEDVQLMIGSVLVRATSLAVSAFYVFYMSCAAVEEGLAKIARVGAYATDALGITTGAVDKLTEHIKASTKAREDAEASMKRYFGLATSSSKDIAMASKPMPEIKGKGAATGGVKETGLMSEYEAELERLRIKTIEIEGEFVEIGKRGELEFWQSKLSVAKTGSEDYKNIQRRVYSLQYEIEKEGFAQSLAEQATQIEEYRRGSERRVEIAYEIAQNIGDAYGYESREYISAVRKIRQEERAQADYIRERKMEEIEIISAHNTHLVEMQQEAINFEYEMGNISREEQLAAISSFEDQKYDLARNSLEEKLALLDMETEAYRNLYARLLEMQDAHERQKAEISREYQRKAASDADAIFSPFNSALEESFTGMVQMNMSLRDALINIWRGYVGTFINFVIKKIIQEWLLGEVLKLNTSKIYAGILQMLGIQTAATQVATQAGASAATTTIKAGEATAVVTANAAEAASGAAAAVAPTPFVGPALAAAAFGAILALVLGALTMISAEGGAADIPKDTIAQVHKKEMILPAPLAERVRAMTDTSVFNKTFEMIKGLAMPSSPMLSLAGSYGLPADITAKIGSMEMGLPSSAIESIKNMASSSETRTEVKNITLKQEIKAWDSKDMTRAMRSNRSPLGKAIKELMRDGHIRTKR
jgi:hypothetical protein